MVKELAGMGTKAVLLTGDNRKEAEYFASRVGVTDIRAELLPENKVENIRAVIGDCQTDAVPYQMNRKATQSRFRRSCMHREKKTGFAPDLRETCFNARFRIRSGGSGHFGIR